MGVLLDILYNQILQHERQADLLRTLRQFYFHNRSLKNPIINQQTRNAVYLMKEIPFLSP